MTSWLESLEERILYVSLLSQSVQTPLQLQSMAILERRRRERLGLTQVPQASFLKTYRDDPIAFANDCIAWKDGEKPTPYQCEVMGRLLTEFRVAVRGPHSLGKSFTAAVLLHWFALTRDASGDDWKVPTLASAWRQLTKFLWPEVHKWARVLRWDVIGREPYNRNELLTLSLNLRSGSAFAMASNVPERVEGAHASQMLMIFDESKIIPPKTWESAEGAFAQGGKAYWLAVSTPGEPVGTFYDIHHRKPGYEDWWVRHVKKDEAIAAGRMDADWAEQRRKQWGADSAVYLNRVEGEFASADSDGVIPLAWAEAAVERWREWADNGKPKGEQGLTSIGVDVAREGQDKTVIACVYGDVVDDLRYYDRNDTMETTGFVAAAADYSKDVHIVIDAIGIGAGVFDRLREQEYNVTAFVANERADVEDATGTFKFQDLRSATWWGMREKLDPSRGATLMLPPDDTLLQDLMSPKWSMQSSGKIKVESKDDIRRRLGRSTDAADAVIQALVGGTLAKRWTATVSVVNLRR